MSTIVRRKRRTFAPEFKAEAVKLFRDSGKPLAQVARDLGLTRTVLDKWVKQANADAGKGSASVLSTAEREELNQLRREVRTLRMERDFLKKTAAFFAKENS